MHTIEHVTCSSNSALSSQVPNESNAARVHQSMDMSTHAILRQSYRLACRTGSLGRKKAVAGPHAMPAPDAQKPSQINFATGNSNKLSEVPLKPNLHSVIANCRTETGSTTATGILRSTVATQRA